jgi:hypothetical protein
MRPMRPAPSNPIFMVFVIPVVASRQAVLRPVRRHEIRR